MEAAMKQAVTRLNGILLCLLLAAGCANTESHRLLATTIAPASPSEVAATHRIFVATTRAPTDQPGFVFSTSRSPESAFAAVDVSVPAVHQAGRIERSPTTKVADPARYFAARRVSLYSGEEAFERAIGQETRRRGGRALVFIHGFNTGFDSAVYRMTQIAHDSGYGGAPILFAWPSAGRIVDYVYDNNSATAARDALEELLLLVARSGAERIDIVAHSMGTWVTMEALRQLAMAGNRDLGGRLADVVLASPDIDVDVFKGQMRRYGVPNRSFFVLASRKDRALDVSSLIAGNRPRVGGAIDAEDVAQLGVVVVDLTDVSSPDRLGHTTFAENPLLVRLLGEGLMTEEEERPADQEIARRIGALTKSIGQTVGAAADIVITTPVGVLSAIAGGE
jgi:esterase/lipase superfamily enzyme